MQLIRFVSWGILFIKCVSLYAGAEQSTLQTPPAQPPTPPSQTQVQIPKPFAGTINITTNNTFKNKPSIIGSQSNAANHNHIQTNIRNSMRTFVTSLNQQIQKIDPHAFMDRGKTEWEIHKKKIVLGTLASGYICSASYFIYRNHYFQNQELWCNWKGHLSNEELQSYTQTQLGADLIHAIQQRHINNTNPTDNITPMVHFMRAVDYESELITRYLRAVKIIRTARISWLFPITHDITDYVVARKERLTFVKHTFLSWAASYNIGKL